MEINASTKLSPAIESLTETKKEVQGENIELNDYDETQIDGSSGETTHPTGPLQSMTNLSDTMEDDISCPSDNTFAKPILISEFKSHVERLHANRDKQFELEYTVN